MSLKLSNVELKCLIECGCGREYIMGQSHCFCDFAYVELGIIPTVRIVDEARSLADEIQGDCKSCEETPDCEEGCGLCALCCEGLGEVCSNPDCAEHECEDDVHWHEGVKPYCYDCGVTLKKVSE